MLLRTSLLLACAAVVAALASQEHCATAKIGSVTNNAYDLEERCVTPDTFTLEINVPSICPDSETAGMKVMACDVDKAPRVYVVDPWRGLVVREGNLETAASVYITVYCVPDTEEVSLESSELPVGFTVPTAGIPISFITAWDESTSTPVTPSPQPLSTTSPDPLLPLGVEPISTQSTSPESKSEDSLPPVKLESRFSSVPEITLSSLEQVIDPSIPLSLPSRFNAPFSLEQIIRPPISMTGDPSSLWKQHAPPSVRNLNHPLTLLNLEGQSSRWPENEPSSPYNSKPQLTHQPSYDSHFPFLNNFLHKSPSSPWTDTLFLLKRLAGWQPEQQPQWLANRSPAWLKRSTKRPSSSRLRHGSLPDWPTRKSLSRSHQGPAGYGFDDSGDWPLYEDDPLSINWSEERADSSPWSTENQPPSHSVKDLLWLLKNSHRLNEEVPSSVPREFPFYIPDEILSSISNGQTKKNQQQYVPPFHEEDQALLPEWRDPRSLLPKLFLMLQDQSLKCAPGYTVEEGETWWPNAPKQLHTDGGIPWLPDYPTNYSADDGDSFPPYLDEIEPRWLTNLPQTKHIPSAYKEEPSPWLCCREWYDRSPITGSDFPQLLCPCPFNKQRKRVRPQHSLTR